MQKVWEFFNRNIFLFPVAIQHTSTAGIPGNRLCYDKRLYHMQM